MARVGAPWAGHGELTGEGEEGEGGGGEGGAARGRHGEVGRYREGCYRGVVGGTMGLQPLFGLLLYVKIGSRKEKKRRRKEWRKRKGRKRKEEKKEKIWKIFQTWKISGRKIKDNLWSW
jgi:hypothetical protein